MGASFNIPEPLAQEMHKSFGVPQTTADIAAQLFCPVVMQFVTTPMHLMGLDMYNRPHSSWRDRFDLISSNYRKTVAARIARILPAFGFGGIGNKQIRNGGMSRKRKRKGCCFPFLDMCSREGRGRKRKEVEPCFLSYPCTHPPTHPPLLMQVMGTFAASTTRSPARSRWWCWAEICTRRKDEADCFRRWAGGC